MQVGRAHSAHLADEELLLFSDQELSTWRAARVREHVAQCESCRGRLTELEDASAAFAELHERETQARRADSLESRNLLRARLSAASTRGGGRSRPTMFGMAMGRQLASACIALLLVVGCAWSVRRIAVSRSNHDRMEAERTALPRRALTPGMTRAVEVAELCSREDVDNDPPVNASLEQAVFQEYGVSAVAKTNYALDYLITPALGGSDTIQNLWPQPYSSTWNAHVKDQLEDHLHAMVCEGKVQLATAQGDIASDWIAAYKRYFKTDRPEPDSSNSASVRRGREFDQSAGGRGESRAFAVYDVALIVPSGMASAGMGGPQHFEQRGTSVR